MKRAAFVAFVLPVLLMCGASAARAGDELQLARDDLGLRLRRPDASWVVHVQQSDPDDDTLATLSLYQPASQGVPSVTIYVARYDGSETAAQVRDVGAAALEAQAGVVLERNEATLAGHPAARLHGRMDGADGRPYEVELLYAVVPPMVYAVQSGWSADEDRAASAGAGGSCCSPTCSRCATPRAPTPTCPRWAAPTGRPWRWPPWTR